MNRRKKETQDTLNRILEWVKGVKVELEGVSSARQSGDFTEMFDGEEQVEKFFNDSIEKIGAGLLFIEATATQLYCLLEAGRIPSKRDMGKCLAAIREVGEEAGPLADYQPTGSLAAAALEGIPFFPGSQEPGVIGLP